MIKRLVWLVAGFVLGVGSSWAVVRRVRRAVARFAPAEVAERWGGGVQSIGRDLRDAVSVGRGAMHEREAQLRAGLERSRAHAGTSVAVPARRRGAATAGQ
jgi:hypothetical protein